jgi:hypothetical protein
MMVFTTRNKFGACETQEKNVMPSFEVTTYE